MAEAAQERNEALDCRVYAPAVAWTARADRRMEAMFRDLDQQIGTSQEATTEMVLRTDQSGSGVPGAHLCDATGGCFVQVT
jgi:phage terminase large subunit GpA-like protein